MHFDFNQVVIQNLSLKAELDMRADDEDVLEDDEGVDIQTESEGDLPETMLLRIRVRSTYSVSRQVWDGIFVANK